MNKSLKDAAEFQEVLVVRSLAVTVAPEISEVSIALLTTVMVAEASNSFSVPLPTVKVRVITSSTVATGTLVMDSVVEPFAATLVLAVKAMPVKEVPLELIAFFNSTVVFAGTFLVVSVRETGCAEASYSWVTFAIEPDQVVVS